MTTLYPRDPLIIELKGYTAKFLESYKKGEAVTDDHPLLLAFEGCLENIFYCAIKAQTALFGYFWDGSAWRWIAKTDTSNDSNDPRYQITRVIESVKQRKNVYTQDGRFRLAIRYCLVRKCLHQPVKHLMNSKTYDKYYVMDAILADEILTEILLSVIMQLSVIDFKLNLQNSSMLDIAWELPTIVDVDLVPSKDLGITVGFACGKAVIMKIRRNSVAYECSDVNVGDIIEIVNDVPVTAAMQASLPSLLKTNRVQPVSLRIVKGIPNPQGDGIIYPAMIKLYKELKLDHELVRASNARDVTCSKPPERNFVRRLKSLAGFPVAYMGQLCVGRNHEVKAIDKGFATLFWPPSTSAGVLREKPLKQDVLFEVGELGIKFTNLQTNCLIGRHMFMEITACSSVTLMPTYYAFIAKKGSSSSGDNYWCYFFEAPNSQQAAIILQLMGQGFRRTNFAV